MGRKAAYDWDAIEKVYRAGTFSNRQIAEKFKCDESTLRERAKRDGWVKDLKAEVKAATERKLIEASAAETSIPADPAFIPANSTYAGNAANDKRIVESAADAITGIVLAHRGVALRMRNIAGVLFEQLEYVIQNREEVEDAIYEECKGDQNGLRRSRMLQSVSLASNATTLKDLGAASKLFTGIERQAYGLSDKVPDKAPENPANDADQAEQLRYVHKMLTTGPLARPGGTLKVIDQPAANGHANGALNGKGHK